MKYKITDQQAVNYVVKFMRKQGKPALSRIASFVPGCVNVAEDGSRCAIGCMFTKKSQAGYSNALLKNIAESWGCSLDVLTDLQEAHDDASYDTEDFVSRFERLLTDRLPSHLTLPK